MARASRQWNLGSFGLHGVRVAMFGAILAAINVQHRRVTSSGSTERLDLSLEPLVRVFQGAASVAADASGIAEARAVLDAEGVTLGYALQTSPDSDHIVGFSGPTNVLVAFGSDDRIAGIAILSSGDTRDHVRQVRADPLFLQSFVGLDLSQPSALMDVDAVSGATLTSRAIQEAIIHRFGGDSVSLRFPDALVLDDVRGLFPAAARIDPDGTHGALWHVTTESGAESGTVLRTSPFADNIVGYQGPTDTLIGFSPLGLVVGISIQRSYDNEPYVTYVRDDEHFLTLFNAMTLESLATLDLREAEVEGVSGATMTSQAVAKGLVRAARKQREANARVREGRFAWLKTHDVGAAATIVAGLVVGLTRLRSQRVATLALRAALVAYLGLTTGTILSQAMLVGWAQNGIPWRSAPSLVLLSAAAFLVPVTTRRNVYCSHLCPHGAAQQLLRRRLPWRVRLGRRTARLLTPVPAVLLAVCVAAALLALPLSLVDLEPFDAWVVHVAGWPTLTIAVVGLVASLFIPMAYCRYGCPTGALLNFLRFHPRRWTARDWVVVALVLVAAGLLLV